MTEGENKIMKKEKRKKKKIQMCGLEDTAGDETFPKLYREFFVKNQDEK